MDNAIIWSAASADSQPVGASQAEVLRICLAANYASLHRRLLRRLACPDLASDCLHDTWLRLGETALPAAVHDPLAYVYRMACNLAMDALRGNRLRGATPWDDEILSAVADPAPGPQAIAQARSELRELDQTLQQLPYRHGCVLRALRVERRSRKEVAEWLGISVRSVDTLLRQSLAQCAVP